MEEGDVCTKITIGVCVMEKKVKCGSEVFSAPMAQILDRLESFGEFEIVYFGDKVILEDPVERYAFTQLSEHYAFVLFVIAMEISYNDNRRKEEEEGITSESSWPICDCLISFHSSGYPLEKAEAYAALRKPFLVNELEQQHLLHDRRKVYERLEMYAIPVPRYALVNREVPYQELDYFVEQEDFVEVHGNRFWKPFVEKPIDGDNHSIMIYYPSSAGGGMKELFRKVGNRSSEFHPDVRRVRREGSYIYEEFMPTGGTDVKVYTVGPEYAHAEARKSPVVDGVVMRNPDGKEVIGIGCSMDVAPAHAECLAFSLRYLVRYPVLLTPTEKQMSREVCIAFRQAVCGFDLLRCEGRSYVCDVNGWSFVKNSHKYYDDAACVLRKMFLDAKAPHLSSTIPPILPWKVNEPIQPSEGLTRQGSGIIDTFGQSEELRCVIAVIRHGDRTPKQKVKLKVTEEKLLNLMLKYNGGKPRSEVLLFSQSFTSTCNSISFRSGRGSDSEAEDIEHAEKLRQVKAVLEEGGHFSGIYRKVQLKPLKWVKVSKSNGEGEEERPVEALMVLKYGGVLTHAGRKQAEELGRYFRNNMYPGEGTGLLRLHSTYRHDLKIYSSDEGRVQMSAAAFAKGLLDLEGQLTPILVSLVSKDSSMLDGLDNASIEMEEAKARLNEIITSNAKTVHNNGSSEFPWMADGAGLPSNAVKLLPKLVITSFHETLIGTQMVTLDLICLGRGHSGLWATENQRHACLLPLQKAAILKQRLRVWNKEVFGDIRRRKWTSLTCGAVECFPPLKAIKPHGENSSKFVASCHLAAAKTVATLALMVKIHWKPIACCHVILADYMSADNMFAELRKSYVATSVLEKYEQNGEVNSEHARHATATALGGSICGEDIRPCAESFKGNDHKKLVLPHTNRKDPTWVLKVKFTKKVTAQVKLLAKDEDEELVETSSYDVILPYDQAKALGKTNIDVDRIAAGLPCGSEGFLLMFARWKKLERDLYNERKERFDITQIPDVYDSCKYDLLHNAHLNLEGLDELFKIAQDHVMLCECPIFCYFSYLQMVLSRMSMGKIQSRNSKLAQRMLVEKIARRLLGKILIDLRNTREEAITVAELKSNHDKSSSTKSGKEDTDYQSKLQNKNEDTRRSSFTSEKSLDQDDDEDKETKYRLDPKYANVKSPERHVRTRLYFTSESHIHSLMNVLRYCNLDESLQGETSLVCHNALERLFKTKELDYMSYIVLRMFENTEVGAFP
ncbi:hypothetical protein HHK36_015264 [Tetracentron sinense]|uniref:Inositol hexakisphosphate and diphosphoinositol-pentakisphosphate kinase n=1 Tax=Tetracentron sinense TaxID=13715 RepID=A0A834Z4P7_TETSI|nr:hypothetical protein HHK36_015264 [Tetracentron sinense]